MIVLCWGMRHLVGWCFVFQRPRTACRKREIFLHSYHLPKGEFE